MSFAELWPALRNLRAGDDAREFKVLYGARRQPLLVPADSPADAHGAVAFFVASAPWRAAGHANLLLDEHRLRRLPQVRWDGFPARLLFGAAGEDAPCAVLCGSPGPLQKLTVWRPAQGTRPARVAKIAVRPSADEAVAIEEHWLRELGTVPQLSPYLPRLTGGGQLEGGRRYVAMMALPPGERVYRFGGAHRRFLAAMGAAGRSSHAWADTDAFIRLRLRARAIEPLLDLHHMALLHEALHDVEARIGSHRLPACFAHGDFAPWNVRVESGRLFAFDWEYAQAGANPLHDFLHFHLMSRLAQHRPLGPRFMHPLLAQAAEYADGVFGSRSGVARDVGALALHYLLDVVTFYIDASRGIDKRDPVLRSYLHLLEDRASWIGNPAGAHA